MFIYLGVRQLKEFEPLHKIHAICSILCYAKPVRNRTDTELGQKDLHHASYHCRSVADLECLPYHVVWHHLVNLLHKLDEVLALG